MHNIEPDGSGHGKVEFIPMDADLIIAILALLASAAVIVGTVVFLVWATHYLVLRDYRRSTRLHLYVPIDARVTCVLYHTYRHGATLHVEYEFGGAKIVNRFITTHDVAVLAEQSMQVALRIDPCHPTEVVVEPAFEKQAAASSKPAGWGMPLGATAYTEYAVLLLISLLLGGGFAIGLRWLKHAKVESEFFFALAFFMPFLYVTCLLFASSRFKTRDRDLRNRSEEEQKNRRSK